MNGIIGTLKSRTEDDSGCALIESVHIRITNAEIPRIAQATLLNPCCSSVTPTAENAIQARAKLIDIKLPNRL